MSMWELVPAVSFIQSISPAAFSMGWNLHLGGGVLDHGSSGKDLDILAMPRWQTTPDKELFIGHLVELGWAEVRRRCLPHRDCRKFEKDGRVIDLIFVCCEAQG